MVPLLTIHARLVMCVGVSAWRPFLMVPRGTGAEKKRYDWLHVYFLK